MIRRAKNATGVSKVDAKNPNAVVNKGDYNSPQRGLGDNVDPNMVSVNSRPKPSVGGNSPIGTGAFGISQLTFTLTAGATAETFWLGCDNALLFNKLDPANFAKPTATGLGAIAGSVDAVLESFQWAPLDVELMVLQTSTTSLQFGQSIEYYGNGEINGRRGNTGVLPISLTPNPTYQDELVRRLGFPEDDNIAFTWNTGVAFTVLANETLQVNMKPAVAWNRR